MAQYKAGNSHWLIQHSTTVGGTCIHVWAALTPIMLMKTSGIYEPNIPSEEGRAVLWNTGWQTRWISHSVAEILSYFLPLITFYFRIVLLDSSSHYREAAIARSVYRWTTAWGDKVSTFDSRQRPRDFSAQLPGRHWDANSLLSNGCRRFFPQNVKRSGPHSSPSSARLRTNGCIPPHPLKVVTTYCFVKDGDKFWHSQLLNVTVNWVTMESGTESYLLGYNAM
jgi:hypothetical protein